MRWHFVVGTLTAAIAATMAAGQMSPWLNGATYWPPSLPPQGSPPAHWSDVEKSLSPESCGQCHSSQLAEWQTSLHSRAMGPGLLGQLLRFEAKEAAECLQCHAPLAEQRMAFEAARAKGVADRLDQLGIAAAGNSCGGCHVRAHQRFGPPQRGTGAVGPSADIAVHGGVVRSSFFESSQFCARCHQFTDDPGVNGKPLENTFVEWQSSPQAKQGITCQKCHMPDRRHLWRGIHDPDMVRSGLSVRYSVDAEGGRFEITNTGVGHAFPTYVTPKVIMHAVALDSAGSPQLFTERIRIIGRDVRYVNDEWKEYSDTRLMPAETASLEFLWNGYDRVRVWLEVLPDAYYAAEVFPGLLASGQQNQPLHRLISQAAAAAASSHFELFQTELRRP
jgi:hypothetical protein